MLVLTLTQLAAVCRLHAGVGEAAGSTGRSRRAAPLSAGRPVFLAAA